MLLCLLGYGGPSLSLTPMAFSLSFRPPSFSDLNASDRRFYVFCHPAPIHFSKRNTLQSFRQPSFNAFYQFALRELHFRESQIWRFRSWTRSANIQHACRSFGFPLGQPVGRSDDIFTKKAQHFENGAVTSAVSEDSSISGDEFSKTLRLVETAMLAAAVGLAYFLSTLLRIENYFGCFFPLPLVISSLRWGVAASRKTMVATAMLLLVLSGPLKVASYLLMHGLVGLAMGTLWRSRINWGVSIFLCTLVRSSGAMGSLFLSSWLLRDNILALIMINAHASISYMLAAVGINFVPSMGSIYFIFGTLVLLNSGSFVFLLHVLYALFLRRLGLNPSLIFPAWLKNL